MPVPIGRSIDPFSAPRQHLLIDVFFFLQIEGLREPVHNHGGQLDCRVPLNSDSSA